MQIGLGWTLALAIVAAGPASAGPDPLARYRGTSRVLVISTPDAGDPRLAAQRAGVAEARSGFGERDLVVVEAIGADRGAEALRRRLSLSADRFQAVLVGKDGEAKITTPDPIPSQRLFATIDAMPMRREELRRQR